MFVLLAIERGDVNRHIGMGRRQLGHAIGRGDDTDIGDPLRADLFDQTDRADRRTAVASIGSTTMHRAAWPGRIARL